MTADAGARLALGTAQFGMSYGATNARGKVGATETRAIVALARDSGMRIIDTASQYGDSERVIGELGEIADGFRIVTKTPAFGPEPIGAEQVTVLEHAIERSRRTLRRDRLDGLLAVVPTVALLTLIGGRSVLGWR